MAIYTGTEFNAVVPPLYAYESCEDTFFVQFFDPSKESFILTTILPKVEVTSFPKELVFWSLYMEE